MCGRWEGAWDEAGNTSGWAQRAGGKRYLARVLAACLQDQDEWVPLDVVRDLVGSLFASSVKLMGDICPADELNWQEL